ncbi:MAG: hypothetical protein DRI94_12460 [Bacteroidetes bacterium]|nr:MAG: hypothetical protein DRI94_12460 [Bacteroidota bacterium]
MKKLSLLIIIAFIASNAFSQKFTGGIAVSPIISYMKPDISKKVENNKMKFGFNVGLVGDINLTKNFAISTGINVNNFGGSLKYTDSIASFSVDLGTSDTAYSLNSGAIVDYKLQFVEIPISIKGKTNEIGYMTYFLRAGINPMFRWKAKGIVNGGTIADNESIKKEVAPLFMAYNIGGGFYYSLGGSTKLMVEVVYKNGLTDITKTTFYNVSKSDKIILNSISLRVGILF